MTTTELVLLLVTYIALVVWLRRRFPPTFWCHRCQRSFASYKVYPDACPHCNNSYPGSRV